MAENNPFAPRLFIDGDRRQSAAALDIQRGVVRLLAAYGHLSITELSLAGGRRADVVGVSSKGEIWIVEVKSCLADFRADRKWPEYAQFCDRLWFAVNADFPRELLPPATGIILADRFGGEVVRQAPVAAMPAARRKAMLIAIARTGAQRLMLAQDPDLAGRTDRWE